MRVLVVDDSALMRKLISQMLAEDDRIEQVVTARDGIDGLQKARQWKPDVITLDVEMPHMNGIAFLEALLPELPTPVVMISSLTASGTEATMECLRLGAVDFVTKPSGSISVDIGKLRQEIIAKVHAASGARIQRHGAVQAIRPRATEVVAKPIQASWAARRASSAGESWLAREGLKKPTAASGSDKGTVLVAIASSTGGPAALHALIPALPEGANAAYVIVQHLPPGFTKSLAERLDRMGPLRVREAAQGDKMERGVVLIAPGGRHLELNHHGEVVLNDEPPLWGVRPAADVMLRSVAALTKPLLAVILTGMGRDGAMGAKAIHTAGGICLAQDEASCVVYGMPRAAVETGVVARVVPLGEMAAAIHDSIEILGRLRKAEHAA